MNSQSDIPKLQLYIQIIPFIIQNLQHVVASSCFIFLCWCLMMALWKRQNM